MNRFFTLLAFSFVFFATAATAQKIVTFKALGHDDDPILGMSGSNAYFVRLDPYTEINGSKLVLYIEPSQALIKDHSFINILVADKPVYSTRLSQDSIQKISIALNRSLLSDDKRFVKVQIKTLLTVSDDKCKDLDNPAMWVKVKGYSYFDFQQKNIQQVNTENISSTFETKNAIVYPANPSLADLKAVAWAYARLKKTENRNIQVYEEGKMPDTVRNYIMVGNIHHLSEAKRKLIQLNVTEGQGLFYLYKTVGNVVDTVSRVSANAKGEVSIQKSAVEKTVPTEILFVSGADDNGYDKAITALGNMNILNSSFGNYLVIDKAQNVFFKTIDANRSKLSLRQIGGVTNFMSGIGSLKSVYNFKNSDFSFTPKDVEIHFNGVYSGLNPNDRGFFNIYLNGMLINSQRLDQSGKLNASVTINRYQHHKYNTLEAEFRFYPATGNCANSFINFFGEIDVDKSYLESKNPFITNELSFYQYPEAFNSGTTKVVISKSVASNVAGALGEIVYELNNNINADNFPEFVYSDDLDRSDLKKNNIVALLSKDDKIMDDFPDAPIKFNHAFRLYNNEKNQLVYSLTDSTSNGLAQIFYGRSNNAMLVLTATGKNQGEAFLAASRSITEQLSTLTSNVCITDVAGNKYLFNISKSGENLEYVDNKSTLMIFWENYNLYVLLGILVLIFMSFMYVRTKVQKSQEIVND